MTSRQRLLEKISGFPKEKIDEIFKRRGKTRIQVLRELKLIKQDDSAEEKESVEDITQRVLNVELKIEDLDNLTEFVLVCLFVLDIDNPYLDELIILVLGSSMDNLETKNKKWENLIRKLKEDTVEIKPSKFYKGKPYEDEEKSGNNDKTQQQKTLENQLRGYFPYQTSMEETNLELLQCCVRELQNECIRRWKSGEEFGGLLKKSEWETSYVFGTEKMAQVLRRHLNDIDVADSKKTDIGNSNVHRDKQQMAKNATEMIKKLKKPKEEDKFQIAKDGLTLLKQESVGVCFFRLSDTLQVEGLEILGSLIKKIEDEVMELKDKPPSKADILRTLTRHSVGILLWKNHCQASVTCVGENVVLTAAHLFTPDKSEIWNHLLWMYCEKMFPLSALKTFCNLKQQCYTYLAKSGGNTGSVSEDSFKKFIEGIQELEKKEDKSASDKVVDDMNEGIQKLEKKEDKSASDKVVDDMNEEIKKLAEVREEDLVNLYAEEIKIHIGHMEDVEDHFKAKCCRYYVKEVILLDHELDVAVLKIAESNDFRLTHGKDYIRYIRQEIVPMPITSAPVPDGHLFIAAHPFGRTLCMESSVKLLDDSEKSVFVENFITQAILQAVSKNRISILRHIENAETVCARLPVCFFWDKYEAVEKLIKRKLYIDGKIAHSEYPEEIFGIKIDFKKGFIILKKNPENNETTENDEMKKIPIKTIKDNERIESSTKAERLLISERELKDGVWQEYSLEKFWHSNLPKRGELQIPIPSANKNKSNGETTNSGNRQPYRFILTSRYDQASYACQITEDVNDEKKSSLKIKKLHHPIIVEESDKPVVLSLLSEVAFIKCEIRRGEKGELFLKLDDDRMSDCNGTVKLEKSSGSMRPSNTEKTFEIWMNKPFDLPELSLSLQKDSKGKLSLHYSFREGRAKSEKTLYFSLKQEKFLYIELDNKILKKRSGKQISYSVNVVVDEKLKKESLHENVNDKVKDTITKNAEKKNKAIQLKEEVPGKSWTGNILLKRKCTFEYLKRKDTDEHLTHEKYCMLEIHVFHTCEENGTLALTAKSELQNARKWTIEEEDYFVWPTFSWSTDFVLQFCKKENSQVTLSIHNTYDSYRIMEFDPNGKQLPRHIHSSENPIIPGINFYFETKRLGKLGSAKREIVQTINRSLSTNEIKENIVTEEFKTSGMKKYIRMEQLAHTKLIDMEHGASGGACCFIGEQGQLLFHGMFLGACPSFYYNNPECKLFFNKTGTCFNEVLPSECLIDKLKDSTGKAKLDSVTPGSFFIKIEN